ncbi:MAG: UDP-N-acetylmuramoyl-tripeptide--D-alanyl-D-alanine ligase [Actinobacteria bacterium]|nr:UDP-N-acetylmuramoyl-tripeptide--D-alanyl-D-alanine ligase [Actinomycetota bacterium]
MEKLLKTGKKIMVENILKWTGAKLYGNGKNPAPAGFTISSISTDTRTLDRGDFFIPVKGENYDGHDFIIDAVKRGCSGFIFEDYSAQKVEGFLGSMDKSVCGTLLVLSAPSSIDFLLDLSAGYIRALNVKTIGITGSAGKTTTKEFIVSIMSEEFITAFTQKNYNTELGISRTVLEMDDRVQFFVAELGMRGAGQIKRLSEAINLHIGAITSIGASHLEFFNDVSEIALAKAELAEAIALNKGEIFLNMDDEWTEYIIRHIKSRYLKIGIKAYGQDNGFDYNFLQKHHDESGRYSFELFKKEKKLTDINMPLAGYHNIYNACCAAAICLESGSSLQAVKNGIEKSMPEGSRMKVYTKNDKLIIDDCYNASPLSMKAAINTLAGISARRNSRSVAILADMFELGQDAAALHADIGQYLGQKNIDVVIAMGGLSENICESFKKSCMEKLQGSPGNEVYHFKSREELCAMLGKILKPKDTVLVKGSRANKLEKVIDCI